MNVLWPGILLQVTPEIPAQNILQSKTIQNDDLSRLNYYFMAAAGFIFLTVVFLTAFVVYKYRHNKTAGEHVKYASKKWEFATIGVPTVLVAIFLVLSIRTMNKVKPDVGKQSPDVVITGHQWWWEAYYPGAKVVAANEIHLPVGKKLLLKLLSDDVIHDWWVPEFGNKMDMVPSRENYLWVTIKKPGTYYGICSEFCGAQHANMRIIVVAQDQKDYAEWINSRQQVPRPNSSTAEGAQLFMSKTCGNCHRIAGTSATGNSGPDLTHIASRQTLLAGMLINNEENLESWIRDPQKLKPGANMPKFILSDSSVKAIAAYLQSLK